MKKVHFLGIGGSGVAAVAELAAQSGYEVTGCDINKETAYSKKLEKFGIKALHGHSPDHLAGIDLLVVTPAVFFMNQDNPEILEAKKTMEVIPWQEFLGKYLHEGKKVICVAGTHGKTTTTTLLALVLEKGGLDPSAVVGATVDTWGANSKKGEGEIFVTEADEFNDNFLFYEPEIIILNNIEFDHPDFFKSEEQLLTSFKNFIKKLKGEKVLVINKDSKLVQKVLSEIGSEVGFKLIEYSLNDAKISQNENGTDFEYEGEKYFLKLTGIHNVANALGVIKAAKHLGVDAKAINKVFGQFQGAERRLEFIGETNDIKVFDDYAHHPTAIRATIEALRQKFPTKKMWVIIEAHGYARTKAVLPLYKGVFDKADEVLIGPIFKARDAQNFGVSERSIAEASGRSDIFSSDKLDEMMERLKDVRPGDIVLVMGAGESYKWAREIYKNL